jgi:FKBP-type peptidyl-prolyl cis-trans isomerase FkpA
MTKKNSLISLLVLAVVLILSLNSCDPSKKFENEEKAQIQEYLTSNPNLAFERKPSGLYYLEVQTGTGLTPEIYDSAYVRYTGKFLDGTVFDSNVSSGKLYGFIIGENIAGFDEGLLYMKVGGKSMLLVPSALGYGSTGSYYLGMPGYTPLLFDIELVKVVQSGK